MGQTSIKIDRLKIQRCTKSNITEAWTLLQGQPYELNLQSTRDYAGAIAQQAKIRHQELAGLSEDQSLVFHPKFGKVNPFWLKQFRWDKYRLARAGKRYLSVHRVCSPPESRYSRFQNEILEPLQEKWVPIVKAVSPDLSDLAVSRVMAGYINRFTLPLSGFSTTKFFNMAVTLDILPADRQVRPGPLNCTFSLIDRKEKLPASLNVAINVGPENKTFEVQTTVEVESVLNKAIQLDDKDALAKEIIRVQKAAKLNFYGFCTDLTLKEELGAEY